MQSLCSGVPRVDNFLVVMRHSAKQKHQNQIGIFITLWVVYRGYIKVGRRMKRWWFGRLRVKCGFIMYVPYRAQCDRAAPSLIYPIVSSLA